MAHYREHRAGIALETPSPRTMSIMSPKGILRPAMYEPRNVKHLKIPDPNGDLFSGLRMQVLHGEDLGRRRRGMVVQGLEFKI